MCRTKGFFMTVLTRGYKGVNTPQNGLKRLKTGFWHLWAITTHLKSILGHETLGADSSRSY